MDQLRLFAEQVTTVSLDVGTRGILGGQARVPGVSGTWKTLTETVNQMATNLTSQVRAIANVTSAIAQGDLSKTIDIEAQGEIADLKLTVNTMVSKLNVFASEVTRVSLEVGTRGNLGVQAVVHGVEGTWLGLTNNVGAHFRLLQ